MKLPTRLVYWATQLTGWAMYLGVFGLLAYWERGGSVRIDVILAQYAIGLSVSHLLRGIILRFRWLERSIGFILPRLILAALAMAMVAFGAETAAHHALVGMAAMGPYWLPGEVLARIINWTLLLAIWSFCYFAYIYFVRHRRDEIRHLRLETANRENQLGTLRAKLNPHFMFNALNSIRALIDEDPAQAKNSITQLSAILRNAMATVKRKTVPLGEELDIVKAYLALEAIRYEERLRVHIEVEEGLEREPVPPMLLQTLVENAVRHGVATLPQGGELRIGVQRGVEGTVITVRNSGHYQPGQVNGTGIGLRNTRRRLELIYNGRAHLRIENREGMVVTEVELPADHAQPYP